MATTPRTRRTVRVEERQAHRLTCGLLNGARVLEVVEVRRGKAGARSVDLDAGRLEVEGEGDRNRVSDAVELDTLMMRAADASRRSGSIACVTAITPNQGDGFILLSVSFLHRCVATALQCEMLTLPV